MWSKFSVKRPYTVIVGVVMCLLLGVISFTHSTTDLLPEMELPYVVIYTSYPGASAEKVESSLTRVLESSVSTTEDLNNMTSLSSDNLSLIMLEFADDTNMDTAMINLNAKVDMVKGYLDEGVATPTLLAMNPNMMPIMMATMDYDGHDLQQLSDFINDEILIEMEKTKGVASVQATGLLSETVQIVLDQDKIDAINNTMLDSVNSELARTERELRGKLKEVNEGLAKLDEGAAKLESGKQETLDKLSETSVQLQQAAATLIAMDSQVTQLKAEKAAFEQIVQAVDQIRVQLQLPEQATSQDILTAISQAKTLAQQGIDTANAALPSVEALKQQLALLPAEEAVSPEISAMLKMMGISAEMENNGQALAAVDQMIVSINEKITQAQSLITMMDQAVPMVEKVDDAKVKLNNVDIEIRTAEGVREASTSILNQAGIDTSDLKKLQAQLESGKLNATGEMIKGEMSLNSGKQGLLQAKAQIEDGLKQLESARDEALKQADLSAALTPGMISNILMADNFSMPSGYIASDDRSILIKVGDEFASLDEVENLLLLSLDVDGLREIRLKDLASVQLVDNSEQLYTRINGNPGVMLTFQKSSTASTANVCKTLRNTFDELSEKWEGLHFVTLMDQGVYIDRIVDSVMQNFLIGAILAIAILILFLRDIKPTFIIALSIPISLMFAMVLMYFSGVSLNIISLSGLALGVGMLVDNSVVVIENIYRMRNEGASVEEAAIEGAKEVAGAIIASTLTTICVFLPIVFVTGLARQLFVDMGLTIAYSLVASLIVALTLVPMLASKLLVKKNEKKHHFFDRLVNGYSSLLEKALNHRWIVLIAVSVLLVVSAVGAMRMGMTLIPSMDTGQMSITVSMQDEEATEKECFAMYDQVMERLMEVEGIDTVGVSASGSGSMMMMGSDSASTMFYIITDENYAIEDVESRALASLEGLAVDASASTSNMDLSALGGSGVNVTLYGDDLDDLQTAAVNVADQIRQIEGIDVVDDGQQDPVVEARIIVDKDEAMKYGLTVAQIYQAVSNQIKTETTSTTLQLDGRKIPVVIIQSEDQILDPMQLNEMKLDGTKQQKPVELELSDVASIERGTGMNSINRDNGRRYVSVNATLKDGYNITLVSKEVRDSLDTSVLPENISVEFSGENETIMETMGQMVLMILLAVAFIYMIMVAQFQSLLSPFIVMFTIPLAFTGGFLGLILTHTELSIIAMLGFLVLCGIVVNNGIVFIDYANQLKQRGLSTREAMLETGRTRLRPILMTALTTILAMLPLALKIGTGSDMMQGMAIVTIGGLTYATVLTLFVVPILIEFSNRHKDKKSRKAQA